METLSLVGSEAAAALLLQQQQQHNRSPGNSPRDDSVSIDSALQRLAEATVADNEDSLLASAPGVAESLQRLTQDLGEVSFPEPSLRCCRFAADLLAYTEKRRSFIQLRKKGEDNNFIEFEVHLYRIGLLRY